MPGGMTVLRRQTSDQVQWIDDLYTAYRLDEMTDFMHVRIPAI